MQRTLLLTYPATHRQLHQRLYQEQVLRAMVVRKHIPPMAFLFFRQLDQ